MPEAPGLEVIRDFLRMHRRGAVLRLRGQHYRGDGEPPNYVLLPDVSAGDANKESANKRLADRELGERELEDRLDGFQRPECPYTGGHKRPHFTAH